MSIFCGHLSQYLSLPWQEMIWLVLGLLPRVYSKPRGQSLDLLKQPWRPQGCETRSKGWSLTLWCCTIVKARQTQWQSINTAAARNNQSWPLLTSSSSSFVEVTLLLQNSIFFKLVSVHCLLFSLQAWRKKKSQEKAAVRIRPSSLAKQEKNQVGFYNSSPGPNPSVHPSHLFHSYEN